MPPHNRLVEYSNDLDVAIMAGLGRQDFCHRNSSLREVPKPMEDLDVSVPLESSVNEWRTYLHKKHERPQREGGSSMGAMCKNALRADGALWPQPHTASENNGAQVSYTQQTIPEHVAIHTSGGDTPKADTHIHVQNGSTLYKLLVFPLGKETAQAKRCIDVYKTKLVNVRLSVQECIHIKLSIERLNALLQYRLPKETQIVAIAGLIRELNAYPDAQRITFVLQRKRHLLSMHEKAKIGVIIGPPCQTPLQSFHCPPPEDNCHGGTPLYSNAPALPPPPKPTRVPEASGQTPNRPPASLLDTGEWNASMDSGSIPHTPISSYGHSGGNVPWGCGTLPTFCTSKSPPSLATDYEKNEVENCRFFHQLPDFLTRRQRRQLLESILAGRPSGSWLLRFNEERRVYVITVLYGQCIYHIPVVQHLDGLYSVSLQKFVTVLEVIDFYRRHNISTQVMTPLLHPVEAPQTVGEYDYTPFTLVNNAFVPRG